MWGKCATVSELRSLVPPLTRQNCSVAASKEACAVAKTCAWAGPGAALGPRGERAATAGGCVLNCVGAATDRSMCEGLKGLCGWNSVVSECHVYNRTIVDDADPTMVPATNASYSAYHAARKVEACAKAGYKGPACGRAGPALSDAAVMLITLTSDAAASGKASALASPPAAAGAAKPANGAAARRGGVAAALAAALAGAAALAL